MRVPRHEPGPPETLTNTDYANLLRVSDRRTIAGKRDYALLGDCGLRSADVRRLRARDLRRPRANARHHRLYVSGKGGREREVPVPEAVQHALESWITVHPLARGIGLLDEQPLFVRLGRHGDRDPRPLSAVAVHRLVRRHCHAAGVPDRLAHPHALRAYWATHLLEAGVAVHEVSARLGQSTCAPPPATPRRRPSESTRSLTCSTGATRPPGGVGERRTGRGAVQLVATRMRRRVP